MTVLGFDSITMGYAYSQGVPESILGILLAVGAAVGLLGSVVFPFLVRCMGVERTGDFSYKFILPCILELFPIMRFNFWISSGLYGFSLEVACLTLCVASVWAPGTPFDLASVSVSSIADPFAFNNSSTNSTGSYENSTESYTSVILLLTGIILARFGNSLSLVLFCFYFPVK